MRTSATAAAPRRFRPTCASPPGVCTAARHCGATTPDRRAELTTDQWLDVLAQLQDLGVAYIGFSGGEPLMRDDLEELIASIDDRSTTLMFTNGFGYTAERARAIQQAGLFYSAVSIDSPYPDEHNAGATRPQGVRPRDRGHPQFARRRDVHDDLECHLPPRPDRPAARGPLPPWPGRHGVHEVRIHQPIPRGELSNSPEAERIVWTVEDTDRWLDMQEAVNKTDRPIKVSSFPYTEGPRKFGCNAGLLHLYISATGDVWPCDFIP